MTTKLEIGRTIVDKGRETKSRETVLALDDRVGIHNTQFGNVDIGIELAPHKTYNGWNTQIWAYNTVLVINVSEAPALAEKLGAPRRRFSLDSRGNGAQQIGREVTLFVHSDSFRTKKVNRRR